MTLVDTVREQPELARFQFRAATALVRGSHTRTTLHDFFGAGRELAHEPPFVVDSDHPVVLGGQGNGPAPVEYLLHALAACLTSALASIARAKGVQLTEVTATVVGDIDFAGTLGLDPGVRNGYRQLGVRFTVRGDAPPEVLEGLVERARRRSAVFDVLANGVPISIDTAP